MLSADDCWSNVCSAVFRHLPVHYRLFPNEAPCLNRCLLTHRS